MDMVNTGFTYKHTVVRVSLRIILREWLEWYCTLRSCIEEEIREGGRERERERDDLE